MAFSLPADKGLLPLAIIAHLSGYEARRDDLGRSIASVFRMEAPGRPALYLKVEASGPFGELAGEAARLRWLAESGLPCPAIVAFAENNDCRFLLMEALPGRDLVSDATLSPLARVELLAIALAALHRLNIGTCPFDHRLVTRIAAAGARMRAGLVDEADFDATRLGRRAADLFAELEIRRPVAEDLVVAHGDACLPNFIASAGEFSGYIDCGRLGVADRYQDLVLACGSILYNFGEALVAPFLRRYGVGALDPARCDYYKLLDEFF
jgi:aminoglycoside 3'-phosphotransferase-2